MSQKIYLHCKIYNMNFIKINVFFNTYNILFPCIFGSLLIKDAFIQ